MKRTGRILDDGAAMTVAVLQARFSSTRLPGKVLKPLLGRPMLARQLERIGRAASIDRIVVATSTEASDDPIAGLCSEIGVGCYRGSLDDVLDRMYQAAAAVGSATVMRLTGDCPLADPAVLDDLNAYFLQGGYDYASNTIEPTFPDGLDAEVMRLECLEAAWREAVLPSEREHMTPFIYNHPERFRLGSFKREPDLSGLRWTVDEPSDFEFVSRIYEALYDGNPAFATSDVLRLLRDQPELELTNNGQERNEGYQASLQADQAFLAKD
jgi:spore coat polysaccharide biosynthesis protein SpsF